MGFKYKRVNLTAGSVDFPTGNTDALKRSRSETILTKCVEAIIATGTGWALDTTHNATISDFADVPCKSGALTFPGLFLVNNISGCKLFISYFGGNQTPSYCIKDFNEAASDESPNDLFFYAESNHGGLCVSIIPDGSSNDFGAAFDSTFLPDDATRIIGTTLYWNSNSSNTSFASDPYSGYIYSWGLFVTPYCIAVSCSKGNAEQGAIGIPVYAVGRIIGKLAHEEDNATNARYGILMFRAGVSTTSQCEGLNELFGNRYNLAGSSTPYILGRRIGTVPLYEDTCTCICNAQGTWIKYPYKTNITVNPCFYTQDIIATASYVFNKSGAVRWSPFCLCSLATDLQNYGVVPGDAFKGFVDTDLFRAASVSAYGTTFDNGKFISLDANTACLIGWDADNESL